MLRVVDSGPSIVHLNLLTEILDSS